MTPKQRREKLFKDKKPVVRHFEHADWRWLYGAHCYPNPPGGEDDKQQYLDYALNILSGYDEAFIVEDRNRKFKGAYGPIGIVPSYFDGWRLEPHVQWFPWATKLNKVRGCIAFFMFSRYSNEVGVTEIRSLSEHKTFFKSLKRYAPIYYVSKIPHGDHRGDSHLFYIRGKKNGVNNVIHH